MTGLPGTVSSVVSLQLGSLRGKVDVGRARFSLEGLTRIPNWSGVPARNALASGSALTQLHSSEVTSAPLICTSASGTGSPASVNPLYSGLRSRNSGS